MDKKKFYMTTAIAYTSGKDMMCSSRPEPMNTVRRLS